MAQMHCGNLNLFLYIYIHSHIYIQSHIYIHSHIYIYIHTFLFLCWCMCTSQPVVVCQCVCVCVRVNWLCVVVCPQWKSLTKEEQAKCYEQVEQEIRLHLQEHPDRSCKETYVRTPCLYTTLVHCYTHHCITADDTQSLQRVLIIWHVNVKEIVNVSFVFV